MLDTIRSLDLTIDKAERAFRVLQSLPSTPKKRIQKKNVVVVDVKRKVATTRTIEIPRKGNKLAARLKNQANRILEQPVSAGELSKIEVERSIIFELADKSAGRGLSAKLAAFDLAKRARFTDNLPVGIDQRLQSRAREVRQIAQADALLESPKARAFSIRSGEGRASTRHQTP